jgi:hypothetical protein
LNEAFKSAVSNRIPRYRLVQVNEMSTKSKVIVSGVLAAIIAAALIGAVVFTPGIVNQISSTTTGISTSSSSSSSVNTSAQSSSSSSSSAASGSGGSGTLAVLMTDPPTVPDGVTAVYINYTDIEVHIADAGNQTGWTTLTTSGEINLMSIVNESQTVAATNITSGKFNGLRFNVTSATVTFNGANYTADLVYQEHTLYVWIPGGIFITNGQTTGAMIDLSPTVLLVGTTTDPTFAFIPAATGYTLPANSIANHPHIGDRNDWKNKVSTAIWYMTKFQLTSASLSPGALSVSVSNTGNATIIFHMVALTLTETPSGGWMPSTPFGPISRNSEFFVVAPNGSLLALTSDTKMGAIQTLAYAGYALAPGSSATFNYNGPVTMGGFALFQGNAPTSGIVPGQKYIVTVLGSGQHAQTGVTATGSVSTTSTSAAEITTTVTVTPVTTTTQTSSSTTTSPSTTSTTSTSTSTSTSSSTSTSTSTTTSPSTTTSTTTATTTSTSGD